MHCTYGAWGVCCVSTTLNMWLMLRSLYELTTARSVPLYEIAGVWGYSAMSPDLSRTTTMSGHFSCHYGNAKALEASSLGHTRHTWTRTVEDDVAALNIGLTMVWGRALDWTGWRSIVETATLHWGACLPWWWWWVFSRLQSLHLLYFCIWVTVFSCWGCLCERLKNFYSVLSLAVGLKLLYFHCFTVFGFFLFEQM